MARLERPRDLARLRRLSRDDGVARPRNMGALRSGRAGDDRPVRDPPAVLRGAFPAANVPGPRRVPALHAHRGIVGLQISARRAHHPARSRHSSIGPRPRVSLGDCGILRGADARTSSRSRVRLDLRHLHLARPWNLTFSFYHLAASPNPATSTKRCGCSRPVTVAGGFGNWTSPTAPSGWCGTG